MLDEEKCWRAVVERDRSQDGVFLYGVLTTKVFCRPGCAARKPLRTSVRFFETAAAAEAAGLRACLRCQPLNSTQDKFQAVRQYIRKNLQNNERLKLEALSRHFQLSPFHFQRTFKAAVGVTPRKYIQELRMQTLKEDLREGATVTQAVYGAGFSSGSRVYERAGTQLGMTPKQYRSGGLGVEITYAVAETPLGLMMLGATDRGLCFLEFGASLPELFESLASEYPAARRVPLAEPYPGDFNEWMNALAGYLEGERALGKLPLALHGTAFQLKVWNYLQTIPAGSVQSYTEVARGIGAPRAARAVARACAANCLAIVVPCHRVIRGDGGLGGYRWGLDRKRALLDTERRKSSLAN